jgi:hypothetical protein
MSNFGQCWSCVTDLVMPATMATGFRVVAEAIARRWQTARGGLIDDPNYGTPLTDAVNDDMATADLSRLAKSAAAEAEKDERVLSCDVTITLIAQVLMVVGKVTTAQGPFQLVVSVSQVSVTLLQASAL